MELDTPYVHLCMKDNILVGTYKKDLHIDLAVAKQIVRTRLSFTGGRKVPSLILSGGVVSIDKPAREYFSSDEGIQGLSACAIIVHTEFSNFLGNFFLSVTKTKIPVKQFADVSRAEKWLQKFIV
ncbi:hypothetical protein QWZ08_00430 [Ferruginibacter paludis]|uniref:DUF7793 family protein n=1 Tax=Ferruginibacter paludis TaxID=1310417 RepID=UPI0025B2D7B9|nr:hypothetical protein [Ferruginibacter paludis]MDN3654067.1 hypothetical protein [Ferruginibacter paludis]